MRIAQLGPYRIGELLGRGGMGAVYRGAHVDTGEVVAVKVLSSVMAEEPAFRERFEAEIESLKKLRHPNIVRLLGYGEHDGHLFFAMELVEGRSLEQELADGRRFNWREAIDLAVQVCRALKHAHDSGVIHRDLKPANLLLDDEGQVKLSDFGIAKLFGGGGLTAHGGILGTAEYMAPEQADGRPVDPRADLYSLGGVIYAMLARRPPFRGRSVAEVLQLQRFSEPDPLRRFAPETPVELEHIVMRLLSKSPDGRYPNALVVSRHLLALQHGLSLRPADAGGGSVAGVDDGPPTAPGDEPAAMEIAAEIAEAASSSSLAETKAPAHESAGDDEMVDGAGETPRAAPTQRRFTPVAMTGERRSGPVSRPWFWAQVSALIGGLAGVIGLAWYFLSPPSADLLYSRVRTAAESEGAQRAADLERDAALFLDKYPDDPRAAEVEGLRDEVEIERRSRSLERRLAKGEATGDLTPLERAYVEALGYAKFDPDRGLARMRAIIELHANPTELNARDRVCLEMTRRAADRIAAEIESYLPAERAALAKHAAEIEGLMSSDPAAARRLGRALVERYGEKPWAQARLERIRVWLTTTAAPEAK